MPSSVAALRALVEQRFPDALPITHRTTAVATGVAALDHILPSGGLPRGRLSAWHSQGGATAILRAACLTTVRAGERAAWIDGRGAVGGVVWDDGPLLLRPTSPPHALRTAEELLRSGGFGLIVLSGLEPARTETVRLTRAVREGGTAFVTIARESSMASLRMTSRLLPDGYRWRRDPFGDPAEAQAAVIRVHAQAPGWNAHTDLTIPILHHELRLSLDPKLADRRGVRR
ncbi:MAG TPA: hypothetical protein VJ650_02320 [Gemmatimonadaceae bacterium]|nr:hypothetical protein [Gemmatimonadaceae bacterium]